MALKINTILEIHNMLNKFMQPVGDGTWEYTDDCSDKEIALTHGVTPAQVRGVRTQLGRKLKPKESAFEKLIRLHNELCVQVGVRSCIFEYQNPKRNVNTAPTTTTQRILDEGHDFIRDE